MKILIVDDNADDRRLLKYIVERKKHEAIEAGDGLEGLKMARLHRPDLIISDALMPVMDGFQFLRKVKSDEPLRSIPFVFYSATYRADKDVDLALSLGAEAYIIKPKEPAELWEEVEIILQNRVKGKIITPELIKEDEEYLKRYREVVATKLEETIRELAEANSRLVESESFVKNILESVDEGIIVIDREYRIISSNKAYCRQNNTTCEEVLGRHCYEISHHIVAPCYETGENCATRNTFETGQPCEFMHIHHINGGEPIYVETKSYPLKDKEGNIIAVIEIVNNITEKKKLEDQLRQSQKMEAVGLLAGGIAHDFNNILTAIIGYGNLLLKRAKEDKEMTTYVDHILSSAERAANLTQSLLAFSRKQIINPRPVNVNDIIKKIERLLLRLIGEDIRFKTFLADSDLTVMADSGQIEQVLMNFATNARDAMPKGGVLTVETGLVEFDTKFISVHGYGEPGRYALISVSDSGTGMDEKTREKIFEPFFTTKELGKGTGLGLAMVYGIIRQHNGYVNVYSEPGQGTTFKIFLPMSKLSAEEAGPAEHAAPVGGTETVLLAEDNEEVRKLMRAVLEEFGYTVIEAADGEDAVNKFRENKDRIKLFLSDVIMPGKSGKEAYEEIIKLRPDIKTLFMSGYTADIIDRKGIITEGLDFISKPVSPNELLRRIRDVLDRQS